MAVTILPLFIFPCVLGHPTNGSKSSTPKHQLCLLYQVDTTYKICVHWGLPRDAVSSAVLVLTRHCKPGMKFSSAAKMQDLSVSTCFLDCKFLCCEFKFLCEYNIKLTLTLCVFICIKLRCTKIRRLYHFAKKIAQVKGLNETAVPNFVINLSPNATYLTVDLICFKT